MGFFAEAQKNVPEAAQLAPIEQVAHPPHVFTSRLSPILLFIPYLTVSIFSQTYTNGVEDLTQEKQGKGL